MGYRGYGLPISEVVSEGNVGLMQAVKRFEPEKGFRLATYAMGWIKDSTGSFAAGLLCLAGAGLVGVAVVLLLRHDTALENAPGPLVEQGSGRRA